MNWLRNFMQGRYGADQLGFACVATYCILTIVGRFVGRWSGIAYSIISVITMALIVWSIFRMLSRNINKRYAENQVFLKYWNKVRGVFTQGKVWVANKKVYKYFKCPSCKVKVRVPKGKGMLEITCPKCGRSFRKKS